MLNQTDNPHKNFKIAVSVICGDDVKEKIPSVARMANSFTDYTDKIYIGFNGTNYSVDNFKADLLPLLDDREKIFIERISPWEDNFAKSRNEAFALIPLDEYEWVLWADSDDELRRGDKLQELLNNLDSKTQSVMLNYVYATDPKLGETNAIQGRERLFRTDLISAPGAGWKYDLHEVFQFPPGTQLAKRMDEDNDVYLLHHKQEQFVDGKDEATRERNRRILVKMLKADPSDTRARFYFANELYAQAAEALNSGESQEAVNLYSDKAIQAYEVFMDMVDSPDEAYVAAHQIAEIFKFKQAYLNSIEADMQAIMIHSDWPDAWVGIAQSYMYQEQWDKAIFFATVALEQTKQPDTVLIREPLNAEYMPKSILATCYEQIGEYEKATEILEDFKLKLGENNSEELEDSISRLRAAGDIEEPEVLETLREKMYGSSPQKSIAFFTRPAVEEWSTKSMDNGGIGGTETAVCEIARRFAADGWRTVIFGSPPEDIDNTIYDGIEWYNTLEISTTEPFTVMVSLRTPELFDADIPADIKILWCHDVNTGPNFIDEFGNNRSNNIDYIAGVSEWHCSHLQKLYDIPKEKLIVLSNGINLERFHSGESIERQKGKFIWSSSPDRGLEIVLDLWPQIRSIIPEAELHIFYGWNNFDAMMEQTDDPYMRRFSTQMKNAIKSLEGHGVIMRGRISQDELAKEFQSADYWPYLSQFLETSCISILESQAGGCIPFYSPIGGIVENAAPGAIQINGMPMNFTYRKEFLDKLKIIESYTEDEKLELRKELIEYPKEKSWDNSFNKWQRIIHLAKTKEIAGQVQ